MKHKIFGVTGWKNNGKTTMVVGLITTLTKRGYKIATVKHAHHNFDIDQENTDSWQHRQAGAGEVALVSSKRFALMHENSQDEDELTLEQVIDKLSPCDLVLVEGYKNEAHDKLEMRRKDGKQGETLSKSIQNIVAIAADFPLENSKLPVFNLNDYETIADFVENHMHLKK